MLRTDFGVTLALLLSLASAVLCVLYGWSRWNADDDAGPADARPPALERPDDPSRPGGAS